MAQENFEVYKTDIKEFEIKIKPEIEEGNQLNLFCSFTYITPNYSVLFTLEELKKFVNTGNFKVFLVLWDMNTLSNSYFRRLKSLKKVPNADEYIDQKIKEVKTLAYSIGFNEDNFQIYKSSELWKRLISFKDENLFQHFYSILAQIQIGRYEIERDKISHLIQIPMDMFFCNYFHKLYPEDAGKGIDVAFFGQNKEQLYSLTRDLMVENGLIEHKDPVFVLMKNFPYLIHNHALPEWNMNLRDVKDNISGCNLSKKDILTLFRYLENNSNGINVEVGGKSEEKSYSEFYKDHKDDKEDFLLQTLSTNLFSYLQYHKKRYIEESGEIEETVLNISKKNDVRGIASVLKSTIALEILVRSDGTRNTSQISKELGKSVATISTYANKLKKMKLLRVLPDGKLKRNIKGVKINLELGI